MKWQASVDVRSMPTRTRWTRVPSWKPGNGDGTTKRYARGSTSTQYVTSSLVCHPDTDPVLQRRHRGGNLIDQHAEKTAKEAAKQKGDEEEGPPVIWDHSRDMALSGRLMDDKSRDKFIKDARGLSDRFGTGKSGGFL